MLQIKILATNSGDATGAAKRLEEAYAKLNPKLQDAATNAANSMSTTEAQTVTVQSFIAKIKEQGTVIDWVKAKQIALNTVQNIGLTS